MYLNDMFIEKKYAGTVISFDFYSNLFCADERSFKSEYNAYLLR